MKIHEIFQLSSTVTMDFEPIRKQKQCLMLLYDKIVELEKEHAPGYSQQKGVNPGKLVRLIQMSY